MLAEFLRGSRVFLAKKYLLPRVWWFPLSYPSGSVYIISPVFCCHNHKHLHFGIKDLKKCSAKQKKSQIGFFFLYFECYILMANWNSLKLYTNLFITLFFTTGFDLTWIKAGFPKWIEYIENYRPFTSIFPYTG